MISSYCYFLFGACISRLKPTRLTFSSISTLLMLLFYIVTGIFLTPFIIEKLGQEGYGIWLFIISATGHYGLLTLGIISATQHYIGKYTGENEEGKVREVVSTSFAIFTTVGFVIPVLGYFLLDPITIFFKIKVPDFDIAFMIISFSFILSFPNAVYAAIFQAKEEYILANVISIFNTIVRTILTVTLLLKGYGLIGIAISLLSVAVINFIVNIILCRKIFPTLKLSFSGINKKTFNTLLAYGLTTIIITFGDILKFNMDNFIIGRWIDISSIAIFGIAFSLGNYVIRIVCGTLAFLEPRFTNLVGAQKDGQLKVLFQKSLFISSVLSFGALVMTFYFGGDIINFWVGDEFKSSHIILLIISSSFCFSLAQRPSIPLLYALNKHKFFGIANLVEGLLNFTISLLLVKKYGLVGIAIGTSVAVFISTVLIQPIYLTKIFAISMKEYIAPMLIPLAMAGVFVGSRFYFNGFSRINHHSVIELLLYMGLFGGLYLVSIYIASFVLRQKYHHYLIFWKRS